ncbi:hypothetical protein SAMN05216388_10316 [Halorientalis persicus]|uniref:CRISPR system ring nuclease SSO2081-like domain-containing protein n=1 Tax=Halorientalis persicus TaxID=1367881 RepID=A0A1H8UVD9_9EURY|nr:CRISPR-associated ring nuclease [Halorientalis persicus]SEP07106.1 hypothetical protein SAMN05216388_10316 [Halorientalis persicus]
MSSSDSDGTPNYWITTASPTIEAVVNPLTAACTGAGYVPDVVRILDNPTVRESSARAAELAGEIVAAHAGEEPDIDRITIDSEREFEAIVDYHRHAVNDAHDDGATVAIDVTPGRKFMSAIAFQAGIQFGADHVYYLHLHSSDYYNRVYPEIPRPGVDLVDFTEVF